MEHRSSGLSRYILSFRFPFFLFPFFLLSFLPSFLLSFFPFFLSSFLPSFLPSCLPTKFILRLQLLTAVNFQLPPMETNVVQKPHTSVKCRLSVETVMHSMDQDSENVKRIESGLEPSLRVKVNYININKKFDVKSTTNLLKFPYTAVNCGKLPPLKNGSVHGNKTSFMSRIHFQCDRGFLLKGSKFRLCQKDGKWSGYMATCRGNKVSAHLCFSVNRSVKSLTASDNV